MIVDHNKSSDELFKRLRASVAVSVLLLSHEQ